jgi:hypothetical protein
VNKKPSPVPPPQPPSGNAMIDCPSQPISVGPKQHIHTIKTGIATRITFDARAGAIPIPPFEYCSTSGVGTPAQDCYGASGSYEMQVMTATDCASAYMYAAPDGPPATRMWKYLGANSGESIIITIIDNSDSTGAYQPAWGPSSMMRNPLPTSLTDSMRRQ